MPELNCSVQLAVNVAPFQRAQLGRLFCRRVVSRASNCLVVAGLDQRLARQVAGNAQGYGSECHRLVELVHAQ